MRNEGVKTNIGNEQSSGKRNLLKIFAWLMLIFGAITALYFASVMYFSSFDLGLLVPLLAAICLGLYGAVKVKYPEKELLKKFRMIKTIVRFLISLLLLSFIAIESLIIYAAASEPKCHADYVLVLGAGIWGEQVPPLLRKRLDIAQAYLVDNPESRVIVSGGKGNGETISEAEAMKRYLVGHGINESRIIKEEQARSTFENLTYTRAILLEREKNTNSKIIIVSNDFHMLRAKFLAHRLELSAEGLPCRTNLIDIPHGYTREYLAVMNSWLFDK